MIKLLPLILMIFLLNACNQRLQLTPKAYKYFSNISNIEYSNDSLYLSYSLQEMLKLNMQPFTPAKVYTKNVKTFIDTILYSPDKLRLIVFVITKVEKVYQGNYLFCNREQLDSSIKVYEDQSFTIGGLETLEEAKFYLRELCFGRKATDHPVFGEPSRNMDDIRFWKSKEFDFRVSSGQRFFSTSSTSSSVPQGSLEL